MEKAHVKGDVIGTVEVAEEAYVVLVEETEIPIDQLNEG